MSETPNIPPVTPEERRLTDEQRTAFNAVRGGLMSLHRALLDSERAAYERIQGPVTSNGEFFHLITTHDWFTYLRAISEVIVQIDEWIDSESALAKRVGRSTAHLPAPEDILTGLNTLLKSGSDDTEFTRRYHAAIQDSANVMIAHAEVMKALG
jgi:hypothetical protein